MQIGYIGLGKMGFNMSLRLVNKGYTVVAYNRTYSKTKQLAQKGAIPAKNLSELFSNLSGRKTIWLMVPDNSVSLVIDSLLPYLKKGDTLIDGGNTYYKNTLKHFKILNSIGVNFLDVGVSGGPQGALMGASIMVGGDIKVYKKYEKLFGDLSCANGFSYVGKSGSGHFVKMVHNGIEYGMMQSIAEGFDILKNSEFKINVQDVLKPYSNGSVIESKLINYLTTAFLKHGDSLSGVSGSAASSGEGLWAVKTANTLGVRAKVIEQALKARIYSKKHPNYQAKIIQALRSEFGGHPVK